MQVAKCLACQEPHGPHSKILPVARQFEPDGGLASVDLSGDDCMSMGMQGSVGLDGCLTSAPGISVPLVGGLHEMHEASTRITTVDNCSDADQGGKAARDLAVTVLYSPFQLRLQDYFVAYR